MRITPILFLLALTGCTATGEKDDTAGTGDDTGDTAVEYEAGCITVDGGGGYANLSDAVTLAQEGGVIELCDGTYEDAVTVDKAVTIRGASATGVRLIGSGSDVPLTITGAGVTVENLTLESPRTAIVLDGATDASFSAITIAAAGSWGVTASNATASFDGLTIVQPAAGGVQVSGGEVSITNGDFQYPASFGVDITDDAVVNLTSTTITGTLMLSDDVSDGYAIQLDGGTLSMTDSAIAGADGIGIYGGEADITLVNTTISDVIYLGVFTFDSTYDFTGVDITASYLQGAYLDGPSVSLADTTVSTPTGTSCSLTYAEWGQDGNPWCGGLNIVGDTVNLTNVSVSGYENYGLIVQPNSEDVATVTWNGGTIDDVGRWGAYLIYAEGTVTDVAVTNTREPELAAPCDGYIDQSAAFLSIYSDLAFDGVTLQGNAGWGLSSLIGGATVANSTFDGNNCIGFVNYQAQATITGSTFTNGSDRGSVYDSAGVLVIDGNTFLNNKAGAEYEYDYGDYIGRSVYSGGQGQDIVAYSSGAVYVTNNTFTSGDQSVTVSSASEAEITGNTWTDYEGTLTYVYGMPTGTAAIFANNTADNVVGPVVQSYYGAVEISNVEVGTTRASELVTYEWYQDDVLSYSYSYTNSNAVFYVYGYYYDDGAGSITEWPGSVSIEDVSVASSYSSLLYASDAEIEIDGLEVGDVGGYVVGGSWSSYAPDAEISNVSAGAVNSVAFSFSNSYADYGSVQMSGVSVESASSGGISATAIGELDLEDVSLGDVSGIGISTTTRTYDYSYTYDSTTGTYTYTYTDLDAATEVTASNVTVNSSSGHGISLQGGSATLSNVSVSAAGNDAMSAVGLTSLSLVDTTLSAPGYNGLDVTDTYSFYSYASGSYEESDGDTISSLTGVTVTDSGYSALAFDGGSVTIASSSATGAGYNGLDLVDVTADVQGNSFSNNGEYGMTCENVTFTACATNTLDGNVLGAHLGCEDSCATGE